MIEEGYPEKLYDWGLAERAAVLLASTNAVSLIDVPLTEGAVSISSINAIDRDDLWAVSQKERLAEKLNNEI